MDRLLRMDKQESVARMQEKARKMTGATPTPEPGSALLLVVAGVSALGRRRTQCGR